MKKSRILSVFLSIALFLSSNLSAVQAFSDHVLMLLEGTPDGGIGYVEQDSEKLIRHPSRDSIDVSEYSSFFTGPYERANAEILPDACKMLMRSMREYHETLLQRVSSDCEITVNQTESLLSLLTSWETIKEIASNDLTISKKLSMNILHEADESKFVEEAEKIINRNKANEKAKLHKFVKQEALLKKS